MSNGMNVTVVGWAATTPREVKGEGVPFTSFRLATTPRHFDTRQGTWTDGRTEWLTVKVFRDVALNVAESVHRGQPVVVHGRLSTEEWQTEAGTRTGLVLEATALGHDLSRGRARFTRTTWLGGRPDQPAGDDAGPGEREADDGPPAERDDEADRVGSDEPVAVPGSARAAGATP